MSISRLMQQAAAAAAQTSYTAEFISVTTSVGSEAFVSYANLPTIQSGDILVGIATAWTTASNIVSTSVSGYTTVHYHTKDPYNSAGVFVRIANGTETGDVFFCDTTYSYNAIALYLFRPSAQSSYVADVSASAYAHQVAGTYTVTQSTVDSCAGELKLSFGFAHSTDGAPGTLTVSGTTANVVAGGDMLVGYELESDGFVVSATSATSFRTINYSIIGFNKV